MSTVETVILGIVEGLTEYLPVSSTGHMMIAQALLKIPESGFMAAFLVNIQFGAILAVLVLYFKRFFNFTATGRGLKLLFHIGNKQKREELFDFIFRKNSFYVKIVVAFIPVGVIGIKLSKVVDHLLTSVTTVAVSLIVGGVALIVCDYLFRNRIEHSDPRDEIETYIDEFGIERQRHVQPPLKLNYRQALIVGSFQVLGIIPGVSRSAATIIGGLTQRLNMRQAAEFSFFLAVPTITGAALVKTIQHIGDIHGTDLDSLLLGNVVAFVVAILAIKYFVDFISRHGMKLFGYYRIIVGSLILLSPYIFHVTLHISK